MKINEQEYQKHEVMSSIRTRMLVYFLSLLVVTLGIVEVVTLIGIPFTGISGHYSTGRESVFNHLNFIADLKKERLRLWVEERKDDTAVIASSDLIKSHIRTIISSREQGSSEAEESIYLLQQHMNMIKKEYEVYKMLHIIDIEDFRVIVSSDSNDLGYKVQDESLIRKELKYNSLMLSFDEYVKGHGKEEFNFDIYRTIVIDGKVAAILIAHIETDNVVKPLLNTGDGLGETGEALLLDQDRRIIAPLKYPVPGESGAANKIIINAKPAVLAASGHEGIIETEDYRGVTVLAAYRHFPITSEIGWSMIVKQDSSEVFASLDRSVKHALIISMIGIGVGAFLIVLVVRRLSQPVLDISNAACRIEEGDLSVRITPSSSDEVGLLARNFNSMAQSIQDWHREFETKVWERTARLNKLNIELGESEERFRTILENIPGVVYRCELEPPWKVHHISEGVYSLTGRKASEFLEGTLHLGDLIFSEDRIKVNDAVSEGVKEHKSYEVECRVYHADGSVRWVYEKGRATYGTEGAPLWLDGIIFDITERKQSEEALRLSEDKFSKAFRASPTLISITTFDDGKFIDVNEAFVNATGYSRDELIGHSANELALWPEPGERDRVVNKLGHEGAVVNEEIQIQTKSGALLSALWSAEKIDIEGVECIIAITLDLTEQKRLQGQLMQAHKMEAVGQLAGGIAHDFNNILTAIISYSHLLRSKLSKDDTALEEIGKILALSDRAANIVGGLLAFSRKQYFEFVPTGINDIVRNVERLLSKFIREDIDLDINLTDEEPSITADRTQIEQIIINLATNARDAMPDGGKLTIETEMKLMDEDFIREHGFGKQGVYVCLKVSDTGEGMDADTTDRLFEPFYSTKEVGKGTGLGLAIVYGIVKQHNGYINVHSIPGKGTLFTIYIPAVKSVINIEQEEESKVLTGHGEVILLAEDEPDVRDAIKLVLNTFNYKVIEAVDGKDAIDQFREHQSAIKLAIMDVVMPGMNGVEALEAIRRLAPGVKAIFMSGYTAEVMKNKEGFSAEVPFVSKPIMLDKLLEKIREVLQ